MKFMLFVLPTVPATLEERERLRPIGRNNDRYQMMLDELRKLAVFADDAGFDVMSTTDHHFHSEGYECSVAPLMLYTDLAARTKRIRFSPLGLVLPSWDPIRCAEELAVLDHADSGSVLATASSFDALPRHRRYDRTEDCCGGPLYVPSRWGGTG
jgi:alkanesulfonate monooxygenase SsuD/methylene tetrahydromethanopterin reductase-like flavin-dependent oxidoreductase (luciferase family)